MRRARWSDGLMAVLAVALGACTGCESTPEPTPAPLAVGPPFREIAGAVFEPVLTPMAAQPDGALLVGVIHNSSRHIIDFGSTGASIAPDRALFRIASLTKPVTALALARLVTDGTIDLASAAVDCDVHPALCPGGTPITWRQLAMHTSGLPTVPPDRAALVGPYDRNALDAYLSGITLVAPPGAGFTYSTTGYGLLGEGMADAAEQPYVDLVRDLVLGPANMRDARFTVPPQSLGTMAVGHRLDGTRIRRELAPDVFAPSGGLAASMRDLLAFVHLHLDPTEAWAPAVDLVLTADADVPSYPPSVMALGWQYLPPADFYWAGGHADGYQSLIVFHRSGSAIVVLSNNAGDPADPRMATAAFQMLGAVMAAGWEAAG